jgi:hypothetical protein
MALRTFTAFVAGVGVGWVARSVAGSSREALIQAIVAAHRLRDDARRLIVEQFEWAEDMFAEGRARYEMLRNPNQAPLDDEAPPNVVSDPPIGVGGHADPGKRGQAA